MPIYTLSADYIDNIRENTQHVYNVLMRFSDPECEEKAAIDKTKILLDNYFEIGKNNEFIQYWLGLMSCNSTTRFELIDVNLNKSMPNDLLCCEIAAKSKPNKSIVVHSHNLWTNSYDYIENTNKLDYNGTTLTIYNEEEILNKFKNIKKAPETSMKNESKTNNPWKSGSFYLFATITIIICNILVCKFISPYYLTMTLPFSILAFIGIGIFQLKNDQQIKDKNFTDILKIAIKSYYFWNKRDK
ncbi:MAG: hypothetical protein Q8861_06275 [Bacteroidota bacterium]|nr:hypothetical protein [Bacteroidota bacterium]